MRHNKVTSQKNAFGTTYHYDEFGNKIGESRKGLFGTTDHYDAYGKKVGSSVSGIATSQTHYNNSGQKVGTSYNGITNIDHYDAEGKHVGKTYNSGVATQHSYLGNDGQHSSRNQNTAQMSDAEFSAMIKILLVVAGLGLLLVKCSI